MVRSLTSLMSMVALLFASPLAAQDTTTETVPTGPIESEAVDAVNETDDQSSIFIVGATRNTGLEIAKILTERGDKVTALVRPSSDRSALEPLGVTFAVGDAMDPESLQAAFEGGNYSTVISTLGCFDCDPPVDFIGNKNVFEAAKTAGVTRALLVTSVGAGDSADAPPWPAKIFLRNILPLKTQAEDHLKSTGLDYTILRPGALKSAPATGNGYITEDRSVSGVVTRADVAIQLVKCLDDDSTIGKTYAVSDSEMSWPWDMF